MCRLSLVRKDGSGSSPEGDDYYVLFRVDLSIDLKV